MRSCLVVGLVGLVIACGNKTSRGDDDCKLIAADPAAAGRKLRERYPNDPVKAAAIVERCVAPTGTPCKRFAAFMKTMPDLMPPEMALPVFPDAEAGCASMSPAMQRCMQPSYLLGHAAECADVRTREPLPMLDDGHATECPEIRIDIGRDAVTYGRADRRTVGRIQGAIDADALRAGLEALATQCVGRVVLDADPGVDYQDTIAVMNLAIIAGLHDIADAPGVVAQGDPKKAPVMTVTATELLLDGKRIAAITGSDGALNDKIDAAVTAALRAVVTNPGAPAGTVILQAGSDTDARTINQIVNGANAAGFDNLLFDVERK